MGRPADSAEAVTLLVFVRKDHNRRMIKVKARSNESVQQMLRRFKKLCEKEGLTKDVKRNSYYEKPSDRRRRRDRQTASRVARLARP